MKVFKSIPRKHVASIQAHGLLSIIAQIERGMRKPIKTTDPYVEQRISWLYFTLEQPHHSSQSALTTLEINIDPSTAFVYNWNLTIDTTEPVDPRYHSSGMTLKEFLTRSQGLSKYLLTPIRARPIEFNPNEMAELIEMRQIRRNYYDPEVVLKERFIPGERLRIY